EKMQCEGHVGKFVQAGVDVAGRPRHSAPRGQSNPPYPWNDDLTAQAAFDLPSEKARKSRRAMITRQRMIRQKASNLTHLTEHRNTRRKLVCRPSNAECIDNSRALRRSTGLGYIFQRPVALLVRVRA